MRTSILVILTIINHTYASPIIWKGPKTSITEIYPKSPAKVFPNTRNFENHVDDLAQESQSSETTTTNTDINTIVESESYFAEVKMDNFISRLKSFVNGTQFSYQKFEIESPSLVENFVDLEVNIEKGSSTRRLKHKCMYAKHMLTVMVDSIDHLKFYRALEAPGHRLVYKLIELNIGALALYDPDSSLANDINDYMAKILELHHMLYFLRRKFKDLTIMISDMRNMVRQQVTEAEQALEALWNLVPDPEKTGLAE